MMSLQTRLEFLEQAAAGLQLRARHGGGGGGLEAVTCLIVLSWQWVEIEWRNGECPPGPGWVRKASGGRGARGAFPGRWTPGRACQVGWQQAH